MNTNKLKDKPVLKKYPNQSTIIELSIWLILLSVLPFLYSIITNQSSDVILKIIFVIFWLSTSITMSLVTTQRLKKKGS